MGLDMYAYTAPRAAVTQPVDFEVGDGAERIHYWRKHPDLHGWMEDLYRRKGGAESCFNCTSVELALEDLDRLEADIRAGKLPSTSGFFFGESDGSESDDDLAFIAKARAAINQGKAALYYAWW